MFHLLNELCVHVADPCDWRKHNGEVYFVLEKAQIFTKCGKHLRGALTVADVSHTLYLGPLQDKTKQSWLVILSHLLKAVIPELLVDPWIVKQVLP